MGSWIDTLLYQKDKKDNLLESYCISYFVSQNSGVQM